MYDILKIPEELLVPLRDLDCSVYLKSVLKSLIGHSNNLTVGTGAIVSSVLAKEAHDKARELYPTFKEMGVNAAFRYGAFDEDWGYITLYIKKGSNIEIKSLEIWLKIIREHNPGTSIRRMCVIID